MEGLAIIHELLSLFLISARDRGHDSIVGMINRLPVFSTDIRSTEETPTTFSIHAVFSLKTKRSSILWFSQAGLADARTQLKPGLFRVENAR